MTDLSTEASSTSGTTAGPGRLIRRAREQAGLSIEDLGAQIKLSRGTLDALERDDFKTLTEPVYVRGYYRKLSKVLPVGEAELLAAYEGQVAPKVQSPPSKLILSGGNDLGRSSRVGFKLMGGIVLVGVLIGLAAFWGSRRMAETPADRVVPVEPEVLPTQSLTPEEASAQAPAAEAGSAGVAVQDLPPGAANLTLAPTLGQLPSADAVPEANIAAAAASPAAALGRAEVQLQFNSTSWTRIEDATGKSLLSGVIQAGDRQTVAGEAPFSIFLGNAPGVSIQFNGQQVDMVKYTKGNNTARFTLP